MKHCKIKPISSNLSRVLLLYTDKYYLVKQIYPFGLNLIANHLRCCGHDVIIDYPFLPEADLEVNLKEILERTRPNLIGLGIRNLDTCMSCEQYGNYEGSGYRTFYFLPEVKRIVEIIRNHIPDVPIVAGGGAFTISPVAILKKLGIKYGIVGEGEEPIRQFLEAFPDEEKISGIPNMVLQCSDSFRINPKRPYVFKEMGAAFKRERKFNYAYETAGLPVQVKRGCNQNCSYCVEPLIEGRNFVFKNHDSVIKELKAIVEKHEGIKNIFFIDTEFNIPNLEYCTVLVRKIIESGLHEHFRFSSQFLPRPFNESFAALLSEAGFSVILTCDSFADSVLEINQTSYRQKHIIEALELCAQFGIDCTTNLIFGLPGETYETIDHTLEKMIKFPINALRRYEYTIGGRIYQDTPLCHFIEREGDDRHLYGKKSEGYLEPFFYCSPESPLKIKAYIEQAIPFLMDYKNNYDKIMRQILALSYLIDQSRWDESAARFFKSDLAAKGSVYDYFFRKLADSGKTKTAKVVSEHLIEAIIQSGKSSEYSERIPVIRYYLSLLGH